MGQVTIYLEDKIEEKMRKTAKSNNMSQSKWIAKLIKEKISDEWPESVLDLAGAWNDLTPAEKIRKSTGRDAKREKL